MTESGCNVKIVLNLSPWNSLELLNALCLLEYDNCQCLKPSKSLKIHSFLNLPGS